MPVSNLHFQPLTESDHAKVLPLIQSKQPDITPEILGLMKGVFGMDGSECIALALMNRFPVNHPHGWCHGVNLTFRDETPAASLQSELLSAAAQHVIEQEKCGFLLGFSAVSDDQKSEYPESLFTTAGFKLLDSSLDFRGPVPFTQSPEYTIRRPHQDTLHRFDPDHPEDMDDLVAFANDIYKKILPNPRRRADKWLKWLRSGTTHLIYAKSPEGKITGMIEIICEKPPVAYVGDIMVSYRRMGTGLAIDLSRFLEKVVIELGATELSCHVADWNRASQNLIKSFGLTPRGGIKRYLREFPASEEAKA